MAQFCKEELSFVKELPEYLEIECPVCLNILTDPHQVSCCGHNFCGFCIERVKASNGSCPMCKEVEYQVMVNKERFRIINGLEVYCSNKEKGCQWKGELKNMSTHLNKEKEEGECQYEEVKCQYEKCQERKQRRYLKYHQDKECPQRPFQCQYCRSKGTFLSITKDHYEECRQYPVTCPNKCVSTNMPRGSLTAHINECPLQPVDCVFSWAGCNDKPLRKDVHVHTADTKHMTLLAVACGQLKKEYQEMKQEMGTLKKEHERMKEKTAKEVGTLKQEISDLKSRPCHEYSLLPVDVTAGSEAVHFYSNACGWHLSARVIDGSFVLFTDEGVVTDYFVLLAFHEGTFDKLKPKLPKIFAKYKDKDTPLLVDTEFTYQQSPTDILNGIQLSFFDTTVPEGVIKIELGRYNSYNLIVTIYTVF